MWPKDDCIISFRKKEHSEKGGEPKGREYADEGEGWGGGHWGGPDIEIKIVGQRFNNLGKRKKRTVRKGGGFA